MRMLLLLAIASLAILGGAVAGYVSAERSYSEQAGHEAQRLASLSARQIQASLERAEMQLRSLRVIATLQNAPSPSCNAAVAQLENDPVFQRNFTRLAIFSAAATYLCASETEVVGKKASQAALIERARNSGKVEVGGLVTGPLSGKAILPVAAPLSVDASGEVHKVAALGVRLEQFQAAMTDLALPTSSGVFVLEEDGTVVTAQHALKEEYWRGRNIAGSPFFKSLANAVDRVGQREGEGADGKPRIYGFAWIGSIAPHLLVAVTFDKEWLQSAVTVQFLENGGAWLLAVMACLAALFLAAHWTLSRHMHQLVDYCDRLTQRRDFTERQALRGGAPIEVKQIAGALSDLVSSLRERNEALREVNDMARIAPLSWAGDHSGIAIGPDFWRLVGEDAASNYLPLKHLLLRVHPEDRPRLVRRMAQARRSPNADGFEETFAFKCNAGWRQFRLRAEPRIRGGNGGSSVAWRGFLQDIDEFAKLEKLAEQHAEDFQLIFNTVRDGLVVIDKDGMIREINRAACAIFGYGYHEILGGDCRRLLHPDSHSLYDHYLASLSGGESHSSEAQARRADGSLLDIEIAGCPIDLRGERCFLAMIRDITERKQAQAQLTRAQRLEAVGQLTGGVAHDFNNLLQAISVALESYDDPELSEEERSELLALAMEALGRGAELTRHLLAFSRQQPLSPRNVDLAAFVDGMLPLLRRTIGEQVSVSFENQAKGETLIRVDPAQLDTSIMNLALNARDAMPEGGDLSFRIYLENIEDEPVGPEGGFTGPAELTPGSYWVLEVSDSGAGMDEATKARIFEPFFTTKETGKGSGLGLSMVFGFLAQSGGRISVYSELGYGTTFRLYFRSLEESWAVQSDTRKSIERGSPSVGRVLVVEDNPLVRDAAVMQLKRLDCSVVTVSTGAEALALLRSGERFDLLFSDVVMPGGIDGIALAEAARGLDPHMKILLASGFPHSQTGQHSFKLISKPFRRKDLVEAIHELTQN